MNTDTVLINKSIISEKGYKIASLIGRRHKFLEIVAYGGCNDKGHALWRAKCDCGKEVTVSGRNFTMGRCKTSCGCMRTPRKDKDYTGKIFGELTVIKKVPKPPNFTGHGAYWLCRCSCGKEVIRRWDYLLDVAKKNKHGITCGCGLSKYMRRDDRVYALQLNLYQSCVQRKANLKEDSNNLISFDEFKNLISSPCVYCGGGFDNYKKDRRRTKNKGLVTPTVLYYTGIDRIDSTKGYIKDNCAPCCFTCNHAKTNMPKEEFYSWIKKVYTNLKDKGEIE